MVIVYQHKGHPECIQVAVNKTDLFGDLRPKQPNLAHYFFLVAIHWLLDGSKQKLIFLPRLDHLKRLIEELF